MGGKGSDGSGISSYDYYGTIAAVLRCGPVDTIRSLLVDGAEIWSGPIKRTDGGVGNPYTLAITDAKWLLPGGYVRLYWGDDNQTVGDDALPGQPPYRGMAYIVFKDFLFGREKTTSPNIEVVLEAIPRPPAAVIAATALDTDGQANVWAILAELLTSIHGSALDAARLDAVSWQAVHDACGLSSERKLLSYCSPLLTEQTETTEFISQTLALCDGWLRLKSDGTVQAGAYALDPGNLNQYAVLTANDLTEQPQLKAQAWDDVPTGVVVNFTDQNSQFVSSSLKVDDLRALQQAVEPRRETIDLGNFVTRDGQARRVGAEWVKRNCQPQLSGTIKVRPERAVNLDGSPLRVGDRFLLDIEPEPGGAALLQLCRVNQRKFGSTGPVTITFEGEVTQPAVPYTPAWTPPAVEDLVVAELAGARIIPMPWVLSGGVPSVGVLGRRGDGLTVGAHVLFDVSGGAGTFTTLGNQPGFAVPCQVGADYAADASTALRVTITDTRDQHIALEQPGASGAQNDELLLVVYKTTGNYLAEAADGTLQLEWFSIQSSAAVAGNTYDFTVLRARLGSAAQAWATNDVAWIIPRSSLVSFTHGNFPTYVSAATELVFRLAPFSKFTEFDGAPSNLPFKFPTAWQRAPAIAWTTPANASSTLAADGNLTPAATITDKDSNTVHICIYSVREDTGVQTKHFDIYIPRTGSKTLAECFTLAGVATPLNFAGQAAVDTFYTLTVRAEDAAGNIIESRRSLVRLATGGGGGGFAAPILDPSGFSAPWNNFLDVVVTAAAPADRIQYAIVNYGGTLPAAPYSQAMGLNTTLHLASSKRIWARCGDGVNWSGWVFGDYYKESNL